MVTNLLLSPRASKENEGTGEPEEKRYLPSASVTNAALYRKEAEGAWDHALCTRVCAWMRVYVCVRASAPPGGVQERMPGQCPCRPPSPRRWHRGVREPDAGSCGQPACVRPRGGLCRQGGLWRVV